MDIISVVRIPTRALSSCFTSHNLLTLTHFTKSFLFEKKTVCIHSLSTVATVTILYKGTGSILVRIIYPTFLDDRLNLFLILSSIFLIELSSQTIGRTIWIRLV